MYMYMYVYMYGYMYMYVYMYLYMYMYMCMYVYMYMYMYMYVYVHNCIERGPPSRNVWQGGKSLENILSWAPFYALRHVCGVPSFLLSAAR